MVFDEASRAAVLDTNMIQNSSVKENVNKSMILIHDLFVCVRVSSH